LLGAAVVAIAAGRGITFGLGWGLVAFGATVLVLAIFRV
jgi:hypothetical protein